MRGARKVKLERFAILVAQGKPLMEAYQLAGWNAKTARSAQVHSSSLAELPSVQKRVGELRDLFESQLAERSSMSYEEACAYLVGIIKTPIGEINEKHPFAQNMRPTRYGLEIGMPNKVAALRELREMRTGWTAKTQVEIGPSQEMIEMIRAVRNGQPLPEAKVIELPPSQTENTR